MVDRVQGAASSSAGEIAGGVLIAIAAIVLLVAAVAYGAGNDLAFFALFAAFTAGVVGLGIRIAFREARLRRDNG